MTAVQLDRTTHILSLTIGITFGIFISFALEGNNSSIFYCSLVSLFALMLSIQQYIRSKCRILLKDKEESALERLVEMKREVDKTARRYKCLLEGAGNAVFVFNAEDGTLIEVNRKGTELFGYDKNAMLKLAGRDLAPQYERRRFNELVRRVKRRGRGRAETITFRGKEGTEFLGEVEARLIDLDDEKVVHATVRDITYKVRSEKEIKQRNRELLILNKIMATANENIQLDALLNSLLMQTLEMFSAEAGVIHLDKSAWGDSQLQIQLGITDEVLKKLDVSECNSGDSHCCNKLPVSGQKSCWNSIVAGANGWKSIAGIPLLAKQKKIGILHLLTRSESSFSQEDARFFKTVGSHIGIVVEQATIFAELSWKSEELLRSYTLLEKNSHQLALSQRRMKLNLALVERANKDLERLDRMKSHFLGIVSHEFRTPLTSIMGGVQFLMASRQEWSEEERKLIDIINEGGVRLNDIVTNLLKIARLESKGFSLNRGTVLLADIFEELYSHFKPLLAERNQSIYFKDMELIPEFNADREYLFEVFSQLIENAVKFSRDGGEIEITARLVDYFYLEAKRNVLEVFNKSFLDKIGNRCFVQVEIRDSGIGIDIDDHLHIFDKFYGSGDIRHHSSGKNKFKGKGPGVGLSIVKGVVEAHGGMVWVESAVSLENRSGSSFFILIPTEEAELQPTFQFMQGNTNLRESDEILSTNK